MSEQLIQASVEWGVLAKQLVLGLLLFAMGLLYVLGGMVVSKSSRYHGHQRRLWLSIALLMWSAATLSIEPLLQVLGVPDLPLFDWHVLLLVIGCIGILLALVGMVVEDTDLWNRKKGP